MYEDEDESIREVLLDNSPLELCSISSSNSMLLDSHLSNPRICDPVRFHTSSLIDSGCTAMAFADEESIVKRFEIQTKPLLIPRSVRLADGSTQAAITRYFTFRLHIGSHSEILVFFVTNLSKCNPIILGIPWLQLHNPICDWNYMTLTFASPYCQHHCLPWRQLHPSSDFHFQFSPILPFRAAMIATIKVIIFQT